MGKNIKTAALIYALFSTYVQAGTIEIDNQTNLPIKVFLRAHDRGNNYQTATIPQKGIQPLIVDENQLGLTQEQPFYDIIASEAIDSTIEPGWRLLAAECEKLSIHNHTTVRIQEIDSGLKTTCTIVKID